MRGKSLIAVVFGICVAAMVFGRAEGAKTAKFIETDQEAFQKGQMEGTVWTSLGKLCLARDSKTLIDEKAGISYISALAEAADGTLYAATGAKGEIYKIKKGKAEIFATLPDKNLFSLALGAKGTLYVGSGGQQGRIFQVSPEGNVKTFFEPEGAQYIWEIVCDGKGNLFAATGPGGQVFKVSPDGKGEVLFESDEKHILSLLRDAEGNIYAGTDGSGLVYRYGRDGKLFVLYDAGGAEITALAMDEEGNLFVGASGAALQAPAMMAPPSPPEPAEEAPEEAPEEEAEEAPEEEAFTPSSTVAESPPLLWDRDESPEVEKSAVPPHSLTSDFVTEVQMAFLPPGGGPPPPPSGAALGGAVYKITPEGIVTPVFQSTDGMILALLASGQTVLAATGQAAGAAEGGGRIYQIRLDAEEQSPIVTVDPRQIMSLLRSRDGQVTFGTAAPGKLFVMSNEFAKEGTYVSQVHDAQSSARWGNIWWRAEMPARTTVTVATRTGNVADPKSGAWSQWSGESKKSPAQIASPAARFIQFRVTLKTADAQVSPVLDEAEIAYLATNLPPKIQSIGVQIGDEGMMPMPPGVPANPGKAGPAKKLVWQVADPNGDRMRYDVWFRSVGDTLWIVLKKDLAENFCKWDTQTVADGRYEIKVTASDAPDNPANLAKTVTKISEPILVDNTSPEVRDVKASIKGGVVTVTAEVVDATSNITAAQYVVDSGEVWQALAPKDLIFDSQRESLEFQIKCLKAGEHRIAIQATDEAGNIGNAKLTVRIKAD